MKFIYSRIRSTDLAFRSKCLRYVLLTFLSFSLSMVYSQGLVFKNHRLESGVAGADGAVYRFTAVSNGADALLTLKGRSASNIILENVDVSNFGWDKAFQPRIGPRGGTVSGITSWWMEFSMKFVKAGTTTPLDVAFFNVTSLDVDGDGVYIQEYLEMFGAQDYILENESSLSVSGLTGTEDSGEDKGAGKRITGPITNYLDIDTAATNVMVTSRFSGKNNLTFKIGAIKAIRGSSDAAYRYNSMWFKLFNYSTPLLLPVKLSAFNASLNNKKVTLTWTTSMETNVSHYILERSINGQEFNQAAMIFTEDNSYAERNYSYNDNIQTSNSGLLYYRLKMVDLDGKYTYSPIRIIRLGTLNENISFITYPNPAIKEVRITLPASWQQKRVGFEIYNIKGEMVKQENRYLASQTEIMDISQLAPGSYVLKATSGSETGTQRIIKAR